MYILLEPGMEIKPTDEALMDDSYTWEYSGLHAGYIYRDTHLIMRRKIENIKELAKAIVKE